MTEAPRPISDTELDVLKTLWELEEGAVREIQERLKGRDRAWAYTTVQTLLHRLQTKGYVASEKHGRAFVFRPLVSRNQLLDHQLDVIANRVCEGSATPLMLTLVQGRNYSNAEIREFRELLDRLETENKSKKRKSTSRKRKSK